MRFTFKSAKIYQFVLKTKRLDNLFNYSKCKRLRLIITSNIAFLRV